jgi:hypothetical protein
MNYFKVIVDGRCYLAPSEKKHKVIGFYSTFLVKAKSISFVGADVSRLLSKRLNENSIKKLDTFFEKSYVIIDSVYSATEDDYTKGAEGFTFYNPTFVERLKFFLVFFYLKIFSPDELLTNDVNSSTGAGSIDV